MKRKSTDSNQRKREIGRERESFGSFFGKTVSANSNFNPNSNTGIKEMLYNDSPAITRVIQGTEGKANAFTTLMTAGWNEG
jgi:hypothetical protein